MTNKPKAALTTDMFKFIEVPAPPGAEVHPDTVEKEGFVLWPCLFLPSLQLWAEIKRDYKVFDSQPAIEKRIVVDTLEHTLEHMRSARSGWDEPLSILLGPKCAATEKQRAIFNSLSPSLFAWDFNLWQFISLGTTVDGVLETFVVLQKLYLAATEDSKQCLSEAKSTSSDLSCTSAFRGRDQSSPVVAFATDSQHDCAQDKNNSTNFENTKTLDKKEITASMIKNEYPRESQAKASAGPAVTPAVSLASRQSQDSRYTALTKEAHPESRASLGLQVQESPANGLLREQNDTFVPLTQPPRMDVEPTTPEQSSEKARKPQEESSVLPNMDEKAKKLHESSEKSRVKHDETIQSQLMEDGPATPDQSQEKTVEQHETIVRQSMDLEPLTSEQSPEKAIEKATSQCMIVESLTPEMYLEKSKIERNENIAPLTQSANSADEEASAAPEDIPEQASDTKLDEDQDPMSTEQLASLGERGAESTQFQAKPTESEFSQREVAQKRLPPNSRPEEDNDDVAANLDDGDIDFQHEDSFSVVDYLLTQRDTSPKSEDDASNTVSI